MISLMRMAAVAVLALCVVGQPAEARGRRKSKAAKSRLGEIVVYRRTTCPNCDRLENILKQQRVTYLVRNHSEHPDEGMDLHRNCMAKHVSCRGYPLLSEDGQIIETGPAMYRFIRKVDGWYRVSERDEPLASSPEGDGNAQERTWRRNSRSEESSMSR